jgi:hypothetical protein
MMKTPLTLLFQNWTVQSEPPSALSAPASSRDVLADQEARCRFSRDVASRMSYKLVAHHVGIEGNNDPPCVQNALGCLKANPFSIRADL